MSKGSSSYP
jgi:hypothetical protein